MVCIGSYMLYMYFSEGVSLRLWKKKCGRGKIYEIIFNFQRYQVCTNRRSGSKVMALGWYIYF